MSLSRGWAQIADYLSLSEAELALASRRPTPTAQAYCVLQIGYFKAKHAFFRFTWDEVREDCAFVLTRYFNDQVVELTPITKHEHYRGLIRIRVNFSNLRTNST